MRRHTLTARPQLHHGMRGIRESVVNVKNVAPGPGSCARVKFAAAGEARIFRYALPARMTFDVLMAIAGLFLAVTLIAAGGLLTWAHGFNGNEVHTQLAAQQIYFPAANSPAVAAPEFAAMRPYGGQQLTTGAQAVDRDHGQSALRRCALLLRSRASDPQGPQL